MIMREKAVLVHSGVLKGKIYHKTCAVVKVITAAEWRCTDSSSDVSLWCPGALQRHGQ